MVFAHFSAGQAFQDAPRWPQDPVGRRLKTSEIILKELCWVYVGLCWVFGCARALGCTSEAMRRTVGCLAKGVRGGGGRGEFSPRDSSKLKLFEGHKEPHSVTLRGPI